MQWGRCLLDLRQDDAAHERLALLEIYFLVRGRLRLRGGSASGISARTAASMASTSSKPERRAQG